MRRWCGGVGGARLFGAACVMALCLPRLIVVPDELGVAIADAHLRNGQGVSQPSILQSLSQGTPPRLAPDLCRRPSLTLMTGWRTLSRAPASPPCRLQLHAKLPAFSSSALPERGTREGYEHTNARGVRASGGRAGGTNARSCGVQRRDPNSIRWHLHVHPSP